MCFALIPLLTKADFYGANLGLWFRFALIPLLTKADYAYDGVEISSALP
ncbi:MAG: hypothetical protein E1N59_2161 [Puniceicoccaceae bacterium 5H]|nr:MAG: hypothetical protein E1N59_2161 [Puniceicoccaceae bacterium 5H]